MPTSSGSDFDLQFEKTIEDLKNLHKVLAFDVYVSYCSEDTSSLDPNRLKNDLADEGYNIFCPTKTNAKVDIERQMVMIKNCKLFLLLVSDNYARNEHCLNLFYYAKKTLRKPIMVVVVGSTRNWQNSEIGFVIGPSEIYVNMSQKSLYRGKLEELKEQVEFKIQFDDPAPTSNPDCFISYCWRNSADAVLKGMAPTHGAIGDDPLSDPRNVKSLLESKGLSCWLDIEQVGKNGLFQDIADGLKRCKMVVVCVSSDYAQSVNCMMELRFAIINLRMPVVGVVVGTSDEWETTEAGMLILNRAAAKKFDFRRKVDEWQQNDFVDSVTEIVEEKRVKLKGKSAPKQPTMDLQMSAQEVNELAQRRFLRQAISFVSEHPSADSPLLIILDCEISNESIPELRESTLDSLLDTNLNFKCLCEHEFGWHLIDDASVSLETTAELKREFISASSAYLYRILTLLNSSQVPLNIFQVFDANSLILLLYQHFHANQEVNNVSSNEKEPQSATKDSYLLFRQTYQEMAGSGKANSLRRCLLPSGKVLWLCPKHQQDPHVTVISGIGSNKGSLYTKSVLNEHDLNLKEELSKLESAAKIWSNKATASQVLRKSITPAPEDKKAGNQKSKMCAIS